MPSPAFISVVRTGAANRARSAPRRAGRAAGVRREHRGAVQKVDALSRGLDLGPAAAVIGAQHRPVAEPVGRGLRRRSSRQARSASDMFSPCARSAARHGRPRPAGRCVRPSKRSAIWLMIGQTERRGDERQRPEETGGARDHLGLELGHRQGGQAQHFRPALHPDDGGAGLAVTVGQGHQREGAAGAVDLGRDIVVRDRVGDGEGQRLLAVAGGLDADPQRLAHRAVRGRRRR